MIEAGKTEYPRFVDWHVGWHTDQEEKHAHTRKKKEKTKGSKLLSFEAQERWRASYGTFALSVLTFFFNSVFVLFTIKYICALFFPMCYHHLLAAPATSTNIFFERYYYYLLGHEELHTCALRVRLGWEKKKTKTKYMMGKKNSKEDRCYSPVIGEKHKRTYLNSSVIPSGLFQSSNHILLFSKLFIYIYILSTVVIFEKLLLPKRQQSRKKREEEKKSVFKVNS